MMAGQYRKLIKDYAKYVKPLQDLAAKLNHQKLLKQRKFPDELWTEECEGSFVKLKELLTSAPVLGHPNFHEDIHISNEASYTGIGRTLYQMRDNQKVVKAYTSRILRPSEARAKNLTFLELLALKWLLTEPFKHFLLGGKNTHLYRQSKPCLLVHS